MKISTKNLIRNLTIVFAFSLVVYFAFFHDQRKIGADNAAQSSPYPADSFIGAEGELAIPSRYRDKVIVMNIWATWCKPCVDEMPSLDALAADYKKRNDVVFIAVSQDVERNGKKSWQIIGDFLEQIEIKNLIIEQDENGALGRILKIKGVPTTIIFKNNREVARFSGFRDWTSDESRRVVSTLIEYD